MLTYSNAKFADIKNEVPTLLQDHWDETEAPMHGVKQYNLNEEHYALMEDLNYLHVCIARDKSNKLVGYVAFILTANYHKDGDIVASLEGFFLDKKARNGFIALKFLRFAEDEVKKRGAKIMQYSSPVSRPCDALYRRLGARMTETIWHKEI